MKPKEGEDGTQDFKENRTIRKQEKDQMGEKNRRVQNLGNRRYL